VTFVATLKIFLNGDYTMLMKLDIKIFTAKNTSKLAGHIHTQT